MSMPLAESGGTASLPAQQKISRYLAIIFGSLFLTSLALAGAIIWLGKSIGVTTSLIDLADLQAKDRNAIALPFDLRYFAALKLPRIAIDKPDVIFISSSRAGAMHSKMLAPYKLYNMSFTAWTLDQVTDVLERATRDFVPRVVIFSLDYFMLTDAWPKANAQNTMRFSDPFYQIRSGLNMMQTATRRNGFPVNCIIPIFQADRRCDGAGRRFVGTGAVVSQEGFRQDGSYRYSLGRIQSSEKNITPEFLVSAMPGAHSIAPSQMLALERLAALAHKRGITLVGIQLPFIKNAVDYLDFNESYRWYSGVWREFESKTTADQFHQLGITFFDLSRAPLTQDRSNFIDSYHPAEIGMLRSLDELMADPRFREIFPAISPEAISGMLNDAESNKRRFYVYGD